MIYRKIVPLQGESYHLAQQELGNGGSEYRVTWGVQAYVASKSTVRPRSFMSNTNGNFIVTI